MLAYKIKTSLTIASNCLNEEKRIHSRTWRCTLEIGTSYIHCLYKHEVLVNICLKTIKNINSKTSSHILGKGYLIFEL